MTAVRKIYSTQPHKNESEQLKNSCQNIYFTAFHSMLKGRD